jgi:hypothetical protein
MDRQIDMVIDRQTDGRKKINRRTKGQFAPQAGRLTDSQIDSQTTKQTSRCVNEHLPTDRQTHGWMDR